MDGFEEAASPARRGGPEDDNSAPVAEAFYADAIRRVILLMSVLAAAGTFGLWVALGRRFALGFVAGAAISLLNFIWLKQAVHALAERIVGQGRSRSSRIVVQFLLRYLLIALVAYVILSRSMVSIYGLFSGLFLPVAAIGCEAGYEAYAALRHGW